MKQTFTVGTCRYTVQAMYGSDQIIAMIKKMGQSDSTIFDRWREVYDSITEDVLMANRVAEVTEQALKCKPRKPTVRADSRVYPKRGAEMSTAVYVREYHLANVNRYRHGEVLDWIKTFYQPLSERITPIEGEYEECLSCL